MFFYITKVWISFTFTILNKSLNAHAAEDKVGLKQKSLKNSHADEETIAMLGKYNLFFIIAFTFYFIDVSCFDLSVLCQINLISWVLNEHLLLTF